MFKKIIGRWNSTKKVENFLNNQQMMAMQFIKIIQQVLTAKEIYEATINNSRAMYGRKEKPNAN